MNQTDVSYFNGAALMLVVIVGLAAMVCAYYVGVREGRAEVLDKFRERER